MSIESLGIAELPLPGDAAVLHSDKLVALIRADIDSAGGVIGFDRFMDLALYAPGLGYYAGGARKLGEVGDFVTAPEISPLFSRCVANQAAQVLEFVEHGDIVEVGAGSGALAGEVMRTLLRTGGQPRRYLILEISPDLRERQRECLGKEFPECVAHIQWIDDLPATGFRGVLIANELLDAFPASRFQIVNDSIAELGVGWGDRRFVWVHRHPHEILKRAIGEVVESLPEALPPGYVSEISPVRVAWTQEMLGRLKTGVAFIFDYGYQQPEYYHPQRTNGTLCCYYRHRMHEDPFIFTGLQDVTTHVDFTAVARAARDAGARVAGFTTQANFLLSAGLLDMLGEVSPGSREHAELTSQVKRLTLPGEMGELVKVLALARDVHQPLIGFRERDLGGQL